MNTRNKLPFGFKNRVDTVIWSPNSNADASSESTSSERIKRHYSNLSTVANSTLLINQTLKLNIGKFIHLNCGRKHE